MTGDLIAILIGGAAGITVCIIGYKAIQEANDN